MQYNIFINQKVICEKYPKLDIVDAAILYFLIYFCGVDNKKLKQLSIEESGITYRYTWVSYSYLISEMPLLGINQKASVTSRLKKLKDSGFIKTYIGPDQNVYVRILDKVEELRTSTPLVETNGTISLNKPDHLFEQINHNTNEHNTKNNIYTESLKRIHSLYQEKIQKNARLTEGAKTKIITRLKSYSEEDLIESIINFSKDSWWMQNNSFRGIQWFFYSDDRIEQFLNLKQKKSSEGITLN